MGSPKDDLDVKQLAVPSSVPAPFRTNPIMALHTTSRQGHAISVGTSSGIWVNSLLRDRGPRSRAGWPLSDPGIMVGAHQFPQHHEERSRKPHGAGQPPFLRCLSPSSEVRSSQLMGPQDHTLFPWFFQNDKCPLSLPWHSS